MKTIIYNLKAIFFLMALFFTTLVAGQSNYLGAWNVVNADYQLNGKWSAWGEVQTRSQKFFNDFFYHELKGGGSFKPNKNVGLLIGFGQYATYSNGGNFKSPVLAHEFRMWEQLTLVNNINRIKIEHRYRIEQRWRGNEYRNRFRYRINPVIPINKSSIEKGCFYASVFDEIFLSDQAPHFERNRLFAGLGYQPLTTMTIQMGWIRQYDYNIASGGVHKDFFQTTLLFRFHQKQNSNAIHPSTMD